MFSLRADLHIIDVVRQFLQGEPYRVRSTGDGVVVLDVISQQPPDMILLDVGMPGLAGFGVIARLQQDPRDTEIPGLIVTAKTLSDAELPQVQQRVASVVQKQALDREVLIGELSKIMSSTWYY